MNGFAGFENDGGARSEIASCRIVDGRISVLLPTWTEGDGIAIKQFAGKQLISAGFQAGKPKLTVRSRPGVSSLDPVRTTVTHLAFVEFDTDAVELIGRRKIYSANDEGFRSESDGDVFTGGILHPVWGPVAAVSKNRAYGPSLETI